jgi:peptide deformylase
MLKLVHHSDPILKQKSAPIEIITDEIKDLANQMVRQLPESGGIGLAACQVNFPIQLFVVDIWWPNTGNSDDALVFINPQVRFLTTERSRREEGCLSFPGIHEMITRCSKIEVTALDIGGQTFTIEASGLLGVAIQHEYDHLQGTTFIDRMGILSKRLAKGKLKRV